MFKSLPEFNDAVYDFLRDVINGHGLMPGFYEDCFKTDLMDIIAFCAESKYIYRVEVWRDGNGDVHAQAVGNVHVTPQGLAFIEAHSEATVKKLRRELYVTRLGFWVTFLMSVASFIRSFFFS